MIAFGQLRNASLWITERGFGQLSNGPDFVWTTKKNQAEGLDN